MAVEMRKLGAKTTEETNGGSRKDKPWFLFKTRRRSV